MQRFTTNEVSNELNDLYVIATVFNPAGFKKRFDLYYQFERHMKDSNINLITIECVYGANENETNNSEFSVTQENNPNHIRVKTKDPLWHKENLTNVAISKLPSNWKYVLWLDADIEFLESDWSTRVLEAFKTYDIIQVFKYAHFLGPDAKIQETHFSLLYSLVHNLPIDKKYYSMFYPHPGYGWGITRQAYEDLNGLIDYGILGSGDCHMAFALINRVKDSFCFNHNEFNANYYGKLLEWQEKAYKYTLKGKVGFSDCTIKHHFHGYREDRKYVQRMKILIDYNYDPTCDIVYNSKGLIEFNYENKNKSQEEFMNFKEEIKNYFAGRKEDRKVDVNDMEMTSVNLVYKTPEEILKNALKVKRIIETEQFKEIMKNMFDHTIRNENGKSLKNKASDSEGTSNAKKPDGRSKSSSARFTNKKKPQMGRNCSNTKKMEMFIEMHMEFGNSNNLNDSEDSGSTEELNSIHDSFLIGSDNSTNPNRSFTYSDNNTDKLMYKNGACCNKPKKENLVQNQSDRNMNSVQGNTNNQEKMNSDNYNNNNNNYNNNNKNNVNNAKGSNLTNQNIQMNHNNAAPLINNQNDILKKEEERKKELEKQKQMILEQEREKQRIRVNQANNMNRNNYNNNANVNKFNQNVKVISNHNLEDDDFSIPNNIILDIHQDNFNHNAHHHHHHHNEGHNHHGENYDNNQNDNNSDHGNNGEYYNNQNDNHNSDHGNNGENYNNQNDNHNSDYGNNEVYYDNNYY